ncbi:2OG-Fe(II) oxygenase [Altererythrobacter sp. GH1-8]|uniref:2OG-Fe(II) oxygenase n=1 Tax=Altererythrobacter sp. GH1-8 TaxID=3349333 RepID=UPI00374D8496
MPLPPPPHLVADRFLSEAANRDLLRFAIGHEDEFAASKVEGEVASGDLRKSLRFDGDLSPIEADFSGRVDDVFEHILDQLGIPPFEPSHYEIELVAHGDGAYYKHHIDTFTRHQRLSAQSDRVVSCVYYFHTLPRTFEGGDLALFGIGATQPYCVIEPANNRMVAFPSFVMHEVKPVRCAKREFSNARFSLNCWIHRSI